MAHSKDVDSEVALQNWNKMLNRLHEYLSAGETARDSWGEKMPEQANATQQLMGANWHGDERERSHIMFSTDRTHFAGLAAALISVIDAAGENSKSLLWLLAVAPPRPAPMLIVHAPASYFLVISVSLSEEGRGAREVGGVWGRLSI